MLCNVFTNIINNRNDKAVYPYVNALIAMWRGSIAYRHMNRSDIGRLLSNAKK